MKTIFLIILIAAVHIQALSQVRHIKGQKGVEALAGITEDSNVLSVGYSQYLNSKLYLKGTLGYENGSISSVDFTAYLLEIATNYNLIKIHSKVFLNALLGGGIAYEETETLESTLEQTGFSPGVFGGLEIEIFINDRIVLVTNGTQRYYPQSALGEYFWMCNTGIKYIF